MSYYPSNYGGQDIALYLQEELQKIANVVQLIADGAIDIRNVAPENPRNGLYYADGTNWNPGSGKGIYRYDEDTTSYVHLG